MRTRFLCIDYFDSAPIKTLEFLRLPPPHLPLPSPSTFNDFRSFDAVSDLNLSLELDSLPIGDALSKFFSDVLPAFIDVETRVLANNESCSAEACFDKQRNFSPRSSSEVQATDDFCGPTFNAKEEKSVEVVEFEMPELDISLENARFFEKEKLQLFAEVLEVDCNLDITEPDHTIHYPSEILESFYVVDDITPDHCTEQKAFLLEDAGSVQDQVHPCDCTFPLLEVDEISLGIIHGICADEQLLLDNIEPLGCTERGKIMVDCKELLGSLDVDLLGYISGHCFSKQWFNVVIKCSNTCLEMDLISIIEQSHTEGNPSCQRETLDDGSVIVGLIEFEETQFFDSGSYQFQDVFYSSVTVCEAKICEEMLLQDSNFGDFNELIVCHELTPIDESFKSLPIPILSDHEKIRSPFELVEKILASLESQPPSASDGIYLDWRFLEEDYGNNEKYSSCWKQVLEINKYSIDPISFNDGMVIFEFVFNSDTTSVANVEDDKETLYLHSVGVSTTGVCPNDSATSRLDHDECQKHGNQEILSDIDAERVSSLVGSISPFDDLNFFLNPREVYGGRSSRPSVKIFDGVMKSKDKLVVATAPTFSSLDQVAQCATTTAQLQPWDLKLHLVKLSGYGLGLIDNFQKNYLAILKSDSLLSNIRHSCLAMDDITLLSLPKEKLLDWIKETNGQQTILADGNTMMTLITLCAIKQLAWYFCYYGIHATYLYLDKLCCTLDCLKYRLNFLQILIEDMHAKAERDITASHPSLSVIQAILQSHINNCGTKLLIVADQVFWSPLKRLLTSMQISHSDHEICTYTSQPNLCKNNELIDTKADATQHSDCLLISSEHISASYQLDKFSIILEYGGSCSSSRISNMYPKPVGFPGLHFIKVELEDFDAAKALCEGVHILCNNSFITELEELLNFIPHEDKYQIGSSSAVDDAKSSGITLSVPCIPLAIETEHISKNMPCVPAMEIEQIPKNKPPFPDTVLIVNTQNFDKEMIISRRSTYRKILAMEKRGVQVVERDLKHPVDVIISAEICLVWYDRGNIRKKATAPDEASSCLPLCIENIAASILTSLSFSFSGCILIFEGESSFLAAVMESSDELYAASASLNIDLQLFLSHSSELTDELILSCIESATKLSRHIYPKMPESETLAESFLTSFPSLNPLSAHAILSSGGIPVEFLEWSHERRIRAIQKYHVSNESVSLLSTLCRFGEREDSRSAMTDCSSSVSSAPESGNRPFKYNSVRKEGVCIGSLHKTDMPMDDLFHFEPLKQFADDDRNRPIVSKSQDDWILGAEEIFDEIGKPGVSSCDLLFSKKQGTRSAGGAVLMDPSKLSKHFDSGMPRIDISNDIKKHSWPFNDKFFGSEEVVDVSLMNKLDCDLNNNAANLREDLIGEVVDIGDNFPVTNDFSSIPKSRDLSSLVLETDKQPVIGNPRTGRELSFRRSHIPTFPTAAEISSEFSAWDSVSDTRQSSKEGVNKHTDVDFTKSRLPTKHQVSLSEEGSVQEASTYFPSQSVRPKYTQQLGGTPLSNAVQSAQPQEGSPWTIEFLNRIREKSRLRQQALPPNMSPLCSPYSDKVSKATKRKSPSILDFFKYQGGSTPRKIIEQKRQRKTAQPPASSKKEKMTAPHLPIWTPLDKRARRALSFSTGGGGGQSKLVWSDKDAQSMDRRFYH